jgi:hypothetical protein
MGEELFEGLAYAVDHDQLGDCSEARRYRRKGALDGVDVTVPDEFKPEKKELTLTVSEYLEFMVLMSAKNRR